ncbi:MULTISPECIES: serine hydrolase domain-containing protein [Chryseobacterium]|uniref:serine hydrolase domain-containing protein n=1 Tax=Chryseobacterium TaxID=59732 RepID=UPI0019584FD1|nr:MULTISPECIES: serine hydrolase domain-containing protein [Chryseobacterium]MBM7419888.1 CubicO group peptidase (beta-lactamase class C family) [Chryseobacterium sp. JUb44]MDH6209826.1 CubicO group peptidase (beta-lactamase class C family) [Chryseobacterium sp. BIGb0186]WSO08565.1 serine hydrolase domain-containing protein [Chryseobacterium scophthalmum]
MNKFLLPILFSVVITVNAQEKTKADKLDSLFTKNYEDKIFNGNVLIAEKGKIIFQKSFGVADYETKRLLNNTTIFELASVSKQFTAMGIVLLEKQGKLKYDDPISKFIPELSFYKNITVRNLLNHTGGLPDYIGLFQKNWDKSKFATNKDIVTEFAKYKPEISFQPSEKYEYSNTGYALLGYIIEKASGKTFGDYLEANIFKPLGMKNTFVYRSRFQPKVIENYAKGFIENDFGSIISPDDLGKSYYTYYLDGMVGDGMVNSTTEDLLKWDRSLYTDKLVNEKDKAIIFQGAKLNDGKMTNYGFGWQIGENKEYGKVVAHSGSWAGYTNYIERNLSKDQTIIILQNIDTHKTQIPAQSARKIINNEKIIVTTAKKAVYSDKELNQFLGVYSAENFPMKVTITKENNILYAQATGQDKFPTEALENNIFTFDLAGIKLIFNPEKNEMILEQEEDKTLFKKE